MSSHKKNSGTTEEIKSHEQQLCRLWLSLLLIFISIGAKAQGTDTVVRQNKAYVPQMLSGSHFTWGADMGSSVDLTGHNLTTFDLDINFGYASPAIQVFGLSVGLHRALGSGNTFVPICGILRTSFRSKPSRFFLNLKAGYSFNTIQDDNYKGGLQLSAGLGIILQRSKKVQSHIILGYGYYHINRSQVHSLSFNVNHVDFAQLSIGVNF